jgi:hypothetical protein
MIDKEQWSLMGTDIKGKIYEGLLRKMPKTPKAVQGNILRHVLNQNNGSLSSSQTNENHY